MISIILTLVIVSLLGFWGFLSNKYNSTEDKIGASVAVFALWLFVSLVASAISISDYPITRHITENKIEIYSLRNSTNAVYGKFSIENYSEKYYMFKKTENGGYQRITANANNTAIFQDEDVKPYIKWETRKNESSRFWSLFVMTRESEGNYEIHVPSDTVIEKYKVD